MIKRRWTPEEDKTLLEWYNGFNKENRTDVEVFEAISSYPEFQNRTAVAIQRRYYVLTNTGNERQYIRKDEQYNGFIEGIQALKQSFHEMAVENRQLKKRIEELEKNQSDYEVLQRVMDQARKLVVSSELGDHETPRFRMDQNGNLNRL